MQSLALQSAHFDAFCPSQVSSAGSVQISAWTMSLTRVQDVSVHDIHKRKKPRKHYVSQYFCVVLCLVASRHPFLVPGHVRESKTVYWILDCTLWVPGTVFCSLQQWKLDSGFQRLGFRNPQKKFPRIPLHGAILR